MKPFGNVVHFSQRVFLLGINLVGLFALAKPVLADPSVRFGLYFRQAILDQALDKYEFQHLIQMAQKQMEPEDAYLARNLFKLLNHYSSLVHLSFSYVYQHQRWQASFLFSPNYAEDELLQPQSPLQFLSQISQQDLLSETRNDTYRCGAAALLAAHLLLYQNLNLAFQRLQYPIPTSFTYRQIHLAQERLYEWSNTDGEPGLSQRLLYQVEPNGQIQITRHEGEILQAAHVLGMDVLPLKSSQDQEAVIRGKHILSLWSEHPNAPLLVGVYLEPETGAVLMPHENEQIQNHFVLIFQSHNQLWMYNSGVPDNGRQTALRQISPIEFKNLVLESTGSVNILLPKL